jgi:hypothetical protein
VPSYGSHSITLSDIDKIYPILDIAIAPVILGNSTIELWEHPADFWSKPHDITYCADLPITGYQCAVVPPPVMLTSSLEILWKL